MMRRRTMKGFAALCLAATILGTGFTTMASEQAQNLQNVEQKQEVDVAPHCSSIFDENGNVYDGEYAADIDLSTIKDAEEGFTVEVKILRSDEYNFGAAHSMKKGDTILYDGKVVTVDTIEEKEKESGVYLYINGGYENGGITLVPGEGGACRIQEDDDSSTYEVVAQGTVFIGDKTVLTDTSDLENREGSKYEGAKAIKAFMEETSHPMNRYNTRLVYQDGDLKEIKLFYTP